MNFIIFFLIMFRKCLEYWVYNLKKSAPTSCIGKGPTNDGNTATRFFLNYEESARITGLDVTLLKHFRNILIVINCGKETDVENFRKYAYKSEQDYRNVRSVITYISISVQEVRFLKNHHFWKIKSSIITNLDRRIRNYLGNYYRNDTKQPIH